MRIEHELLQTSQRYSGWIDVPSVSVAHEVSQGGEAVVELRRIEVFGRETVLDGDDDDL